MKTSVLYKYINLDRTNPIKKDIIKIFLSRRNNRVKYKFKVFSNTNTRLCCVFTILSYPHKHYTY